MEELAKRLNKICDHNKWTKYSQFADRVGISHQTASNYLKGKQKPDSIQLEKIIRSFENINARWLITGEGEMLLKSDKVHVGLAEEVANILKEDLNVILNLVSENGLTLNEIKNKVGNTSKSDL